MLVGIFRLPNCRLTLKIPDAIIAATARVTGLELLTLDQQFLNQMSEILRQTE